MHVICSSSPGDLVNQIIYGPFDTRDEALAYLRWLDTQYSYGERFRMIKILSPPSYQYKGTTATSSTDAKSSPALNPPARKATVKRESR